MGVRAMVLGTVGALLLWTATAQASRSAGPFDLTIAAAPLGDALNALAQQSGLQVLFSSRLVEKLQAPEVKGRLTVDEALRRLLAGTDLRYEFVNSHTITVTERTAPASPPPDPPVGGDPPGRDTAPAGPDNNVMPKGDIAMPHRKLLARLLGLFVLSGSVAAQTVPDNGPLEEIVVTATKRVESVQNVPLSISVVSQNMLQTQNVLDTSALTRLVPAVTFNQSFLAAANNFSVRGVGTAAGGVGVDQSVGVAFDGVPLGSAAGSVADLVDVQHVEVLKGPQGMLFGKNASAGLINIVSNAPQLGQLEAIGRVSYGTLNDQQYTGTVNLPVGDTAAIRVSGWKFKRDGTILEVNTGQHMNDKDSDGARARLRWLPMENLDVNFTGEWTSHDQNGAAYTIRQYEPANFTPVNAGALVYGYDINTSHQNPGPHNRDAYDLGDVPYFDRGHTAAYTLQGDYTTPSNGVVTSVLSYRRNAIDQSTAAYPSSNPYNNQPANIDVGRYEQFTGELRYASPVTDRLHYVAGLFYFHEKLQDEFTLGILAPPLPTVDNLGDQRQTNESYAGFGEATFDVTSQLHLIAGFRESHDDDRGSLNRMMLNAGVPIVPFWNGPDSNFGVLHANAHIDDNFTSWRGGVQYQLTPDVMVYGTASRGYKGPGVIFNVGTAPADIAASNGGVVKPEIATSYELGVKSQWFDRRLTANAALFDETFTNFQTTLHSPISPLSVIVANAPRLKSDGVDLDASLAVTNDFSVSAAMTYANARFTNFPYGQCYSTTQTPAQGCVDGYQNLAGKPLFNSPKVSTSIDARYDTAITAELRYFLDVNDSYRTKQYFEAKADPNEYQSAYNVINLATGIRAESGHWGVTASVANLANSRFVDTMLQQQGVFIGQIIGYDTLRTYHVALDARF